MKITNQKQSTETAADQTIKADANKPSMSLVPTAIFSAIARVREYGVDKYGTVDGWRDVEPVRYKDALLRHTPAFMDDTWGVDEESGLPHLWHMACNLAFIIELKWGGRKCLG